MSVVDELAEVVFKLDTRGLSARAITARVTAAIVEWASANGWAVRTEARIEIGRPHAAFGDYGYMDAIIHRAAGEPDIAIEIDQTDKPWSVAKLRYANALGMEAVWIRWSGSSWTDAEGVHVIHLPELERERLPTKRSSQLTLW